MLDVTAIDIQKLPFGNTNLVTELLSFQDEPLLMHLTDEFNNDIISYWVDLDDNHSRWLLGKITKDELYKYLSGGISLKNLFSEIRSEYLFLVDYSLDDANDVKSIKLINSYLLPEKYYPKDNSYYSLGLSDYYYKYLAIDFYKHSLLKKSYKITLEASDKNTRHDKTVSAKDAGMAMLNYANSIHGYAYVRAYNKYSKLHSGDKIVKQKATQFADKISSQVMEASICCFEFSISMDTSIFHDKNSIELELSKVIIDDYKNEVLNVNFGDEEEAKVIADNYTTAERKKIFEPIFKVLENENIDVTVTDYKKSFNRNSKNVPLKPQFRDIIIPPKSLEDVIKDEEKKQKIYTIVLTLKEGTEIGKIKIKQLMDGLLFTEEGAETSYPILSPIANETESIDTKYPLKCKLYIDADGNFNLSNSTLLLSADGNDLKAVIREIKDQFIALVNNFRNNPENKNAQYDELRNLLV